MQDFYDFALNQASYPTKFLPYYETMGIRPTRIVQYVSSLSYELPISAGTALSIKMSDTSVFTSVLYQWTGRIDTLGIIHDPEILAGRRIATVVEFNYCTSEEIDLKDNDTVNRTMDLALEGMNCIISAYNISCPDDPVSRLTKESLDSFVPAKLVRLPEWDDIRMYVSVDKLVPHAKTQLAPEKINELLANARSLKELSNPFLYFQEHFSLSRKYMLLGQYDWAVLSASTGIEALMRTVCRLASLESPSLLVIKRKPVPLEDIPFHHVLTTLMSQVLGGTWDLTNESSPPGKWHSSCYVLRNRILHGGFRVNAQQAEQAVITSLSLREYIYDLLDGRRKNLGFVSKYLTKKPKV